jgi:hemerythrin
MEKIIWNNKFCTGIAEIDGQHNRIISQINYLIDNLNSEDKAYLNGEIIRKLDKYSKEHFFTEEEFLRKINYPNREDHLKLHQAFKMNTIKLAITVLKGNDHVPEETIKFLKKWWSNHILKADMEYKNFIPKS